MIKRYATQGVGNSGNARCGTGVGLGVKDARMPSNKTLTAEQILAEDAPAIRAVNPRMWILQTDYPDLDFRPSLRAFITQRAALLKLLEPLQYKEWTRSATVMGAGKPLQLTVLDYARRMALHERPHIKQIARMVEALR